MQGKYDLAVPGALQSLKFAIDVYGAEASELVPSYLLLAEAAATERCLRLRASFLCIVQVHYICDYINVNIDLQRGII